MAQDREAYLIARRGRRERHLSGDQRCCRTSGVFAG